MSEQRGNNELEMPSPVPAVLPESELKHRPITCILTHENPDMDASLCVWLLHRYGGSHYSGIREVPVMFMPAGTTPDNLHPDEMERIHGILAVDTGGGRLDTHARPDDPAGAKREASAAQLVARDIGIEALPELQKLLRFVTHQESSGRSIASTEPMDHVVSLPNIIRGLNLAHPDNPTQVVNVLMQIYDGIALTEKEWYQAVEDFRSARIGKVRNNAKVAAVFSDTGAAVKVARQNRCDLIIHRNSLGHTGITCRNGGALAQLNLNILAPVIRIAEARLSDEALDYPRLASVGVVHGWYLHDSGRIFSKGSPKNRQMARSQLTLDDLFELTIACLDGRYGVPESQCLIARANSHRCEQCPYHRLNLTGCQALRERFGRSSP